MAEQSVHDVVDQTMSVGDLSPSDAHENNQTQKFTAGEITNAEKKSDVEELETTEQDGHPLQIDTSSSPMTNGVLYAQHQSLTGQPSLADPIERTDNSTQNAVAAGSSLRNHSLGDSSHVSESENLRADELATTPEDAKNLDGIAAGKKTTSFKPVSFAKYSAAKVAGLNAAAKSISEKALLSSANASSSSLQQVSRPRLVAKTTGGLRDSGSASFKTGGRNGAPAPDPMQVWNKNRPTQPSSTKHLTDEELKQQYGIHMTSRIEADGENKEAKWADIDDDEDDWAPDTIEWADGTKVTLNHTTTIPPVQEVVNADKPPGEPKVEVQPSKPKGPQIVTSVGPNATVLKLGASAGRQQAQKASFSQLSPAERPTILNSKSPAPAPAKSPWAALPPVDKISPITISPQIAVSPLNRNAQMTQMGPSQSAALALSPAKEISADDFNRSWRDSQPDQPRELFMPSSGRYEAVNESRRRGSRNDSNFRAPALLQRPAPNDQQSPAEPSAAFQTNRMSSDQERGSWHRRASSIQSGESGQFGRRGSISRSGESAHMPPPEKAQSQRGSSQAGSTVGDVASSRGVHVQPTVYQAASSSATGMPGRGPDATLGLDQKRLMQESARLAVQRRQETEQREEAARKERIRLKLEQLGPPPTRESTGQQQRATSPTKVEESTAYASSPPKPPVPEASGKPKQYGMMKVHHPDNVKKLGPLVDKVEADTELQYVSTPPKVDATSSSASVPAPTAPDTATPLERSYSETQNKTLPGESNVQSWKISNAADDTRPGWGNRGHLPGPVTSNLWGPANLDKALGNGTFDQNLTGMPARDLSARNNSQPANWFNGRPSSHERSPKPPQMPVMQQENLQSSVPFTSPEQRPIAANSEADSLQPIAKPLPIGPPQAQSTHQKWHQPSNSRSTIHGVAAWNNFHTVAARDDRAENERIQRDLASSLEEEARSGTRKTPQYTFQETWKQVETGDQPGDRQITAVVKGTIGSPFPAGQSYGVPSTNIHSDRAANGLPIRGSRFFPTEARRAATYSHPEVPRSASPPPAEEVGCLHPVYEGDTDRPVISLPIPKAVVKLPKLQQEEPSMPVVAPPPRTFAAAAAAAPTQPTPPKPSLRTVSQPLASTPDWQIRFREMLGRGSPLKRQALEVASATRESLDVISRNVLAAVSLPSQGDDRLQDAGEVASRNVEEQEDLFEDREVASRPLVHLPNDVPRNLSIPGRSIQPRSRARYLKGEVDPLSKSSYDGVDDHIFGTKGKDIVLYISLPGWTKSTKKTISKKAGAHDGASKVPKGHSSSKHNKKGSPRSREYSGPFQHGAQHGNRSNGPKMSSAGANGPVLAPRSGFSYKPANSGGLRGGHFASAGIAH